MWDIHLVLLIRPASEPIKSELVLIAIPNYIEIIHLGSEIGGLNILLVLILTGLNI